MNHLKGLPDSFTSACGSFISTSTLVWGYHPNFSISLTLPFSSPPILILSRTSWVGSNKININRCVKDRFVGEGLYKTSFDIAYEHSPLHLGDVSFFRLNYVLFWRGSCQITWIIGSWVQTDSPWPFTSSG